MKFKLNYIILAILAYATIGNAQTSAKEAEARAWILSNEKSLEINPEDSFSLKMVRKTQAGETLRFQQVKNGIPVFDSEILIHFSPDNEITSTASTYDKWVANINVQPSFTEENAIAISNQTLKIDSDIIFQECKLFVYNKLECTKLVYRVLTDSYAKTGSWETIIDAQSGDVLSTKDVAYYYGKHDKKEKKQSPPMAPLALVTGTAKVFNPDPLSKAGVAYGGSYVDGAGIGDVTNTALDNARVDVILPEIDLTGTTYKLKSTYAEIKELGSPNKGMFTQTTPNFIFNRNQDGFEAVNAFYHIDKSLRYINQTLGITCVPYQSANAGAVFFDPHGANSDDNSFYANGQLQFGEGGVDDAEDADVVLHELGHGIHDWITNGNDSQVNGLGEGIGDYWAVSYSRSLNQWPSTAEEYNWVFNWDGHNEWWDGRVVNTTKLYPSGLVGQVHDDGEIWAAASMQVYDAIGKTKSDTAFLEGIANTTSTTNQQNAARAVRQAAIDLNYPCTNIQAMTAIYTARGYSMPTIPLTMASIPNQTVQADVNNTYILPSYATLANPITANCNATLTQSPAIGVALAPGDYTITITATSGSSSVVRTFTLTITANLGIEDATKNNFVLYPNPANNVVNIKGEFYSNESITIYNMLGQVVLKKAVISNEESIDITTLANGVYTMSFNNAKVSRKFVKN